MSAASGCAMRLDPLALPVRFTAPDAVADGRVRLVEISRERVLLSRSVQGMAIRLHVPMRAFQGLAARAVAAEGADEIVLTLEHADPALSVRLFATRDDADLIVEWQLWARALGVPLLAVDQAGAVRASFSHSQVCALGAPAPRRRKRNIISKRRPKLPLRRKPGRSGGRSATVYRERELIARN